MHARLRPAAHTPPPPTAPTRRARAAVAAFTKQALVDLQQDDDEMLRGVDWGQVATAVDITQEVDEVFQATGDGAAGVGWEQICMAWGEDLHRF